MYAYIKGEVAEIDDSSIVIDNNGIGYNITVPGSVTDSGMNIGDEVKIYTHFAVREDAMQLYGFISCWVSTVSVRRRPALFFRDCQPTTSDLRYSLMMPHP